MCGLCAGEDGEFIGPSGGSASRSHRLSLSARAPFSAATRRRPLTAVLAFPSRPESFVPNAAPFSCLRLSFDSGTEINNLRDRLIKKERGPDGSGFLLPPTAHPRVLFRPLSEGALRREGAASRFHLHAADSARTRARGLLGGRKRQEVPASGKKHRSQWFLPLSVFSMAVYRWADYLGGLWWRTASVRYPRRLPFVMVALLDSGRVLPSG